MIFQSVLHLDAGAIEALPLPSTVDRAVKAKNMPLAFMVWNKRFLAYYLVFVVICIHSVCSVIEHTFKLSNGRKHFIGQSDQCSNVRVQCVFVRVRIRYSECAYTLYNMTAIGNTLKVRQGRKQLILWRKSIHALDAIALTHVSYVHVFNSVHVFRPLSLSLSRPHTHSNCLLCCLVCLLFVLVCCFHFSSHICNAATIARTLQM